MIFRIVLLFNFTMSKIKQYVKSGIQSAFG
jgi:hypothetical protein